MLMISCVLFTLATAMGVLMFLVNDSSFPLASVFQESANFLELIISLKIRLEASWLISKTGPE